MIIKKIEKISELEGDNKLSYIFFIYKDILKVKNHLTKFKGDKHSLYGLKKKIGLFNRSLKYIQKKYKLVINEKI